MKYILTTLLLAYVIHLAAQTSTSSIVNQPKYKHASFAVHAVNLSTGKTITAYNENLAVTPASVQKLFTTAAAIHKLGKDTRIETQLAYCGQIKDSILHGDIYIIGNGDPTTGSKYFDENHLFWSTWLEAFNKLGIKKVDGNIIASLNGFPIETVPRKWTWEDLGNYYGAGISSVNFYDNMYKIHFRTSAPGQRTKILYIEPEIDSLKFKNQVISARIRSDQSYILGAPSTYNRTIVGRLPSYRQDFVVKGSIPDPALFVAAETKKKLEQAGIEVTEKATVDTSALTGKNLIIFHTHKSPTIKEISTQTNIHSINLFAEALLRQLALADNKEPSVENGIHALYKELSLMKVDTNSLELYDGSGLARYNTATAKSITSLLEYMYKSELYNDFLSTLPVAGRNGTLKYLGRGTVIEGKFHGKSGSMRKVRAYAGYLVNKNGQTVAVAVIVNNFQGKSSLAKRDITQILINLYNTD